MNRHNRRIAALLAAAALTLGAFGCGDDEDSTESISLPEITTESAPTATTTPTPTATAPTETESVKPPPVQDSESNDVPPPPGSPQEAFEKACKKNPAACG